MMEKGLSSEDQFQLRRAIERLREGLFDPVAVRLLTAHEERLNESMDQGLKAIEAGSSAHLCIVGAYGQGKSHSLTYIQDRALNLGYATSMINLDPREIPFHDFRQVYRALMASLRLPGNDSGFIQRWKAWAEANLFSDDCAPDPRACLPSEMPHLFKSVLTAMAQKSLTLTDRQKQSKKHGGYRPREFPYILSRALMGEPVPLNKLRDALKYRQVSFYREASLVCRGMEPYLDMVRALAQLLLQMGCKGWVTLFDEGESIALARLTARSRSYRLLHRMLFPDTPSKGLFPVFAFTDDFLFQIEQEDYDRVWMRGDAETPYFDKNYAEALGRNLSIYRLHDLSKEEWPGLIDKLINLHAGAYRWDPPRDRLHQLLLECLESAQTGETRLKLKLLVDQIDIAHQEKILDRPFEASGP